METTNYRLFQLLKELVKRVLRKKDRGNEAWSDYNHISGILITSTVTNLIN